MADAAVVREPESAVPRAAWLARLDPDKRRALIDRLSPAEKLALEFNWSFWARPNQLAPPGNWTIWLMLGGRGAGKSKTGAEFARECAYRFPRSRGALVAPTSGDARDVMVEGDSGVLACSPPDFMPTYEPSKRRLTWPNGSIATLFSADKPDRIRGPQHHWGWADELAAWRYPDDAFDNLMFGLRLGMAPRLCVTTTPKPIRLIRSLVARAGADVALVRSSTYENRANLAPAFFDEIVSRYAGTRIGRQEIDAEILEDVEGALWSSESLDAARVYERPDDGAIDPSLRYAPARYDRIVVAVDPSWGTKGDECGIIVAGRIGDRAYVLEDRSARLTPKAWGEAAADAYDQWMADRIVAETAFGAEQVRLVVRAVNDERFKDGKSLVSFKELRASRGKQARAEPVVALYEQGRVFHVGSFPDLEQQMTSWVPGRSDFSPDRVDALVWALTELMLSGGGPSHGSLSSSAGRMLPALGARVPHQGVRM